VSFVASSVQVNAPGSGMIFAPMCLPGCHTWNTAPAGSCSTAMRPASITSNGGASTVPPSSLARFAASSALATVT
jgi:hypothetical protein